MRQKVSDESKESVKESAGSVPGVTEKKDENANVPDLDVTNNGIEIKMWMKCNETSCALDLELSGTYDTYNDLSDCETSVRVKCRGEEYSVPTPLTVRKGTLKLYVVCVGVMAVNE